MSAETHDQAVARGAAFLDKKEPGWERRVSAHLLDLEDDHHCVLGQLWSVKPARPEMLSPFGHAAQAHDLDEPLLIEMGFDLPCGATEEDYDDLTDAWLRLLTTRARPDKG